MFLSSKVVGITAAVLFMLGIVPGMPHAVFLSFALIFGGIAWWRFKEESKPAPVADEAPAANDGEATWDDLQPVDLLGLELGYRLIAMVDKTRQATCSHASRACARNSPRRSVSCRRPCTCATTWNCAPAPTASRCVAWWWARARCSPACSWPSIRAASAPRSSAPRPPIPPSACRRTGSKTNNVRTRKWRVLPWLIPRPCWPRIFHT
ncbi:Flagellar biosynthesis protein FlhA [Hydrogenophaga sp. T4]|nr:Flagellar biosynthesis protein FlhA [Hydrogenophaga sp. T4]